MWIAKFSNGEVLNEVDDTGQEILFGKVLKRLDALDIESEICLDDDEKYNQASSNYGTLI